MNEFNSDILLQIFSYLSAKDSGITVQCCKRFLYLIESFQRKFLEPELVACSSQALSEMKKLDIAYNKTMSTYENDLDYAETSIPDLRGMAKTTRSQTKKLRGIHPRNRREQEQPPPHQVIQQALSKMRSPPNVAFCFYSTEAARESFLSNLDSAHSLLPSQNNISIVCAKSECGVQSNIPLPIPSHHHEDNIKIESNSEFSCMIGSFPNAHFVPFCIPTILDIPACPMSMQSNNGKSDDGDDEEKEKQDERCLGVTIMGQMLRDVYAKNNIDHDNDEEETDFWKVFIVYVVGTGYRIAEDFLQELQQQFPHAAIVGGVCDEGDIRLDPDIYAPVFRAQLQKQPMNQLKKLIVTEWGHDALYDLVEKRDLVQFAIDQMLGTSISKHDNNSNKNCSNMANIRNGVYGLAIGGAVPVRSIVSRGLRSVTSGQVGPNDSQWTVESVSFVRPEQENYPYSAQEPSMLKPIHIINTMKSNITGEEITATEFMIHGHRGNHQPHYIGIKNILKEEDDESNMDIFDGFEVHMFNGSNFLNGSIAIMTDGNEHCERAIVKGSLVDLFELDGKACNEDLENTLLRLKTQLQHEKLLGGIMYSCNGRGPDTELLETEMADAKRFSKHFSALPCLGLYAGGEIGPMATFGNKNIFRKGKVALQGFTAVFAVFVVPRKGPIRYYLDDGEENVERYIRDRF